MTTKKCIFTIFSPPSSCNWQTTFLLILLCFPSHRNLKYILSNSFNKSPVASGKLTRRCVSLGSTNVFTTVIFPRGGICRLLQLFKIFLISLIFASKFIEEVCVVSVENFMPRTWKIPGSQKKFMSLRNRTFEFFLLPIHTTCVLSLFDFNPEKRANFLSVGILSLNDSSLPSKQSVVSSANCDKAQFFGLFWYPQFDYFLESLLTIFLHLSSLNRVIVDPPVWPLCLY